VHIKVSLINLLKVKLVLVGQMQHCEEAEGWRDVGSRPETAIDVLEGGPAVQLLLHLLLGLQNGHHLPPHVHLHFVAGLVALIAGLDHLFKEEGVFGST